MVYQIQIYILDVDGTMRLGRSDLIGSHGKLIFGKRSSQSSTRNATIGYNNNYEFCIADGTDTTEGQLKIGYGAPENTIYCANSGNVGIGTSSPNYKLDVDGDINISSGSSFKINGVAIATTDTTYTAGTGISITGTTISSEITQYSDTDVLNVLSTKGGTGITWNTGTNKFDSDITQYQDSNVTSLLNTGITGGLKVTSGNVGIGTATPDSILDIRPTVSDSFIKINTYAHILINNGNSDNRWTIANRDTGVFSIANNTTTGGNDGVIPMSNDKLTILTGGNVGIGITNPTYKLHVNGSINCTGLNVNGQAIEYNNLYRWYRYYYNRYNN